MATTIISGSKRTEFEAIVRTWEARYRLGRLTLWLPRALGLGLIVGMIVLMAARLTALLTPQQALIAAGLSIGISTALCLAIILRPRPMMTAVRHFEAQFGLQERLSTALELLGGRIQTFEDMAAHQLEDAYAHARRINPKESLQLEVRWREWLMLLPLVLVFILAVVVFTSTGGNSGISAATELAVDAAADNLRDITETVANDTTLSPEERQTLLETLETSLDTLTDKPLSSEEAFASLQDVEQALRNQATDMRNDARTQQEAFDAAAQTLNDVTQPGDAGNNDESISQFNQSFQQMMDNLNNLSESQRQQMADALNEAGANMMPADPELAKAMQNAADAMQQGDNPAAQQALQQAQQQAQQMQNNMQSQQEGAESLENAAQEAQESARNVAESEQQQGDAQQNQDGEQLEGETGEQQGQEGQPNEEGQQPGNGESASQQSAEQGGSEGSGEQQSQDGQPQSSSQGNAAAPAEGMESAEGQPDDSSSAGTNAGGAGDNPSSNQTASGGTGEATTDNNPDGAGESAYDEIYAPQHITSEGTSDIVLEPDTGNVPVTEGNFQENPTGQSVVPYNQVFQNYADAASQSLNSDYIPLSLRDVVQDYFTGLEPKR